MSSPSSLLPLEHLHPALWRAHQLGRGREAVQASGYSALDAELPGGGWPQRAITELLLAGPGWGEIRLLAPALARVGAAGRGVLLLGPPAEPCAEALAQLGLDLSRCVVIRGDDLLWPLEQALRSGQVGAVVAWAPAASRARPCAGCSWPRSRTRGRPSWCAPRPRPRIPARRRCGWRWPAPGPDALAVRLLKRRGPALEQPVLLALPPVLSRAARQRALTPRRTRTSVQALSAIA